MNVQNFSSFQITNEKASLITRFFNYHWLPMRGSEFTRRLKAKVPKLLLLTLVMPSDWRPFVLGGTASVIAECGTYYFISMTYFHCALRLNLMIRPSKQIVFPKIVNKHE